MTINLNVNIPQFVSSPLNAFYKPFPTAFPDVTTVSGLSGLNKYSSAISFKNEMFFLPDQEDYIAVLNTVTKNIEVDAILVPPGSSYSSGIVAWNYKAYLTAGTNTNNIGVLNLKTKEMDSSIATPEVVPFAYSGGFLAPNNGMIYLSSGDSIGAVKIDPATNTLINYGSWPVGSFKTAGVVLSSVTGKGYCVPSGLGAIAIIDPFTDTLDVSTLPITPSPFSYVAAAEGTDKKIYFINGTATNILILDPSN